MALDRQRILSELGSVMKQLQSADCGCLGKLFGNPEQPAPTMGNPLPTCGGCRRGCCHGHGCYYGSSQAMPQNYTNSMPMENPNSGQQPMSGTMFGLGPQIVNMMRGEPHPKPENMSGSGQLTGPMVIDAPQSPHGKVGLTPFNPSMMNSQHGQMNPQTMTQGSLSGQMYPQSMAHGNVSGEMNPQSMAQGNVLGQMNPQLMGQGNISSQMNPQSMAQGNVSGQTQNQISNQPNAYAANNMPKLPQWQPQNMDRNHRARNMPINNPTQNHGLHTQGMAKFKEMFPGVQQGLGGDLGFDPMAIAIQMNPANQMQSAMDTMHKIMDNNQGLNNMFNNSSELQSRTGANEAMGNIPQNVPPANAALQKNLVSDQAAHSNQVTNQQMATHQNIGDPNQPDTQNLYGQAIPQQNQQIYNAVTDSPNVNQQVVQQGNSQQQYQQPQQYSQQQIMDANSGMHVPPPQLPTTYEEPNESNQYQVPPPEQNANYNEPAQQAIKEPIFPVDTSRNHIFLPMKQQKNLGYNTLGQSVEMLPAKMYHPPEPNLPQTLSPQPVPVKPRFDHLRATNVKATISKTSLMGNKPVGKTPSRSQLQHIYNQYKGSQSFTQQNVRNPREGTYSDGRLNVPQANLNKPPQVPIEKVAGDTVVNNQTNNRELINKIDQVMGQIGDVPSAKPTGDAPAAPETPAPQRKCRNGLQDMVFSSYPTTAAWTFHGEGRSSYVPGHRHRSRNY